MNPRRYSQIERALSILDKSGTVDILKDDHYLLFLFKKTERVVSALYVVTGLFPELEPLKWGIRESGTLLLKHVLSFRERATAYNKEFLGDAFVEMAHLHSLLDLAYVADLVSAMNFTLLKKELESLLGILEGKWRITNLPASPPFLEASFFGIPQDIFSATKYRKNDIPPAPSEDTGQKTEEKSLLQGFGEFERFKRNQKDIYKGHFDIKDNISSDRRTESSVMKTRAVSDKKSVRSPLLSQTKEERKQNILAVLLKQGTAMIKDFSSVITGCSEKTIQRLLISMVQDGVLKREGDRRWSRYSILGKNKNA